MKIGVSAFAWTAQFQPHHLDRLPILKEMGLEAVEIPMFDPGMLTAEQIGAAFKANELDCTVCALLPKSCNPISPDPAARQRAIEHLKRCVEASAAMGAKLLGGPLFSPIGYLPKHRPTPDEWSRAIDAFQALRDLLEKNELTLSIEPVNRSETFFLRTAAEAKLLCHAIADPRVGVTVDTFHANIEELSIAKAIVNLGYHLKHVHLSENDRGPLGRGHIPFKEIVSSLRQIGYTGYLIIEGFGYDRAERNAPGRLWASTDVSPQSLVAESLQFLRACIG